MPSISAGYLNSCAKDTTFLMSFYKKLPSRVERKREFLPEIKESLGKFS
jgi:hypothetical protein